MSRLFRRPSPDATPSLVPADLLLLAVAFIWGTSYGVVKGVLAFYPVLGLLALRFGITFVLLLPALRRLKGARGAGGASAGQRLQGLGAGVVLLAIFLAETFGVQSTGASNAAFLISLCVVMTPLVEWIWLGRAPTVMERWAAGISVLGAFLLCGGRFGFSAGDGMVLLAALLRAIHICASRKILHHATVSPLALTAVQSGVVSLGCLGLALAAGPEQWQPLPAWAEHGGFWAGVLYLVLGCTLFAFFVQNHAVRRSNPTRVALLMGSEPVFGALFARVWLGETLPAPAWAGGGLIVLGALLATVVRRPAATAARLES